MTEDFEDHRDLHGVDAADIVAAAEDPRQNAAVLQSLATELGADEAAVVRDVEGAVVEGTRTNPRQATVIALELAQKGEFAVGLLNRFAGDVETFDSEVEAVNAELHSQTLAVWRAEHDGAPTSDPREQPRTHDEVKASVKAQLRPRYERAVTVLDDAADEVASTFGQGPTDANVEALVLAGHIPFSLSRLWPQLSFTPSERERALLAGAETSARAMLEDLRAQGLLDEDDLYFRWLVNAAADDVDLGTISDIIRDHGIAPESFDVLEPLEAIEDPDGKTFFLLPADIGGDDARRAVLMTYVFNAGTDYASASDATGTENDFDDTPYSSEEVQRIIDRQAANDWSYDDDVDFVHGNGGRLVSTPNGIMMGLGGNALQGVYSQQGGTAWGDVFMVNIDDPDDPAQVLREIVDSGVRPRNDSDDGPGGAGSHGALDLDRLLHHEERHSRQWAEHDHTGFLARYLWERVRGGNETEEDAGLSDGGYR